MLKVGHLVAAKQLLEQYFHGTQGYDDSVQLMPDICICGLCSWLLFVLGFPQNPTEPVFVPRMVCKSIAHALRNQTSQGTLSQVHVVFLPFKAAFAPSTGLRL